MGFMKRTLMFPSLQLKKENQTEIYWEHFGESTQGPGITQRVSQDLSTTFKHRAIHLAFQIVPSIGQKWQGPNMETIANL